MDTKNALNSTLLIVDDIPINLKVLFAYLRAFGFKVRVAQDGEEALEQIAHSPPDLILLDVMMPKMDGFEVCRRLKANDKTHNIPIIFMTALTDTEDIVRGFKIGAVDYITKPIKYEEVVQRVMTQVNLRNLQVHLEQKNAELIRQNEELEAFAHTVAHDLKNPLSAVIGFSGLLIGDLASTIDTESLEFLRHIENSSYNMLNIIDSLLLLADVRVRTVNKEPLNMSEILILAKQHVTKTMTEYRGEIFARKDWPIALGYAPWIAQVWANYISNGLKYGGQPPRLELGATPQDDGQIRFWVRDNGSGISQKQQENLFTPFTTITEARCKGHGLGLAIVQRIIEKCDGQVGVESNKDKGSTFYFTLPTPKKD